MAACTESEFLGIVAGLATLLEGALKQIHLYSFIRPFQQFYCVEYSLSLRFLCPNMIHVSLKVGGATALSAPPVPPPICTVWIYIHICTVDADC